MVDFNVVPTRFLKFIAYQITSEVSVIALRAMNPKLENNEGAIQIWGNRYSLIRENISNQIVTNAFSNTNLLSTVEVWSCQSASNQRVSCFEMVS